MATGDRHGLRVASAVGASRANDVIGLMRIAGLVAVRDMMLGDMWPRVATLWLQLKFIKHVFYNSMHKLGYLLHQETSSPLPYSTKSVTLDVS